MYIFEDDIVSIENDFCFPPIKWMKHKNGGWYGSNGNPKRWHYLYSDDKQTARQNFFNGQIGPEKFLVKKELKNETIS